MLNNKKHKIKTKLNGEFQAISQQMIKTSFEKIIPLTNESVFKLRWNHNFLFVHE
jgi:hypothetical protein